jgi:Protein of unknown function (DUF1559)
MRRRSLMLSSLAVLGALIASAVAWGWAASAEKKPVESFLPANSAFYIGWDGTKHHQETWEKTVAYEVLEKSGFVSTLVKIGFSYIPPEYAKGSSLAHDLLGNITQKGFSLSVAPTKESDVPLIVLVLQDAAGFAPVLEPHLAHLFGDAGKTESVTLHGRKVTRCQVSQKEGLEIGWWADGGHLVAAFGKNAVESVLNVADGKAPSITSSANWRKYHEDRSEFDPAFCGWLDMAAVKARYGDNVIRPKTDTESQLTVGQLLKIAGVDRMGSAVARFGFQDRATITRISVEAPAPRTGVLALLNQRAMTLNEIPPLPKEIKTLIAGSFDWSVAYDDLVKLARDIADAVKNNGSAQVDGFLQNLPNIVGFDLKHDLFDALGTVHCFYNDSAAAIPGGLGFGLTIQVKDADKLKKTLATAFDRLQAMFPNGFAIANEERQGRPVWLLTLGALPIHPAIAVDKKWLVVALSPQSAESSLLRIDGKLDPWKPSPEEQAALDAVPKNFQVLCLSDPRPTYSSIVTFLPLILSGIEQAMQQNQPQGAPGRRSGRRMALLSELPPAEVLTRSMFPNAYAWTVDDHGLEAKSRESAPTIVGPTGVAVTAIGVALLLPAVQAAREAARRTQSRNNMKQIMLALHNYHDAFAHFPAGTHSNKELKPPKRLSWMADLLPYFEGVTIHNMIDFNKAWDDPVNRKAIESQIPTFLNPSADQTAKAVFPVTNYIGFAGVGADGPDLPVTSPRAGCFGYDRVTRIRDITDGTSNTVMISESSRNPGPWAAGGRPTLRALTAEPSINGPDGIGDSHPGGCLMGLADGSVRFISEKIEPKVMKSLVTINGLETIDWQKLEAAP